MNEVDYKKRIAGYYTLDCGVRDRNIFYFVLYEDYTQWPKSKWDPDVSEGPDETDVEKRVLVWIRDDPEGAQWSSVNLTGVYHMFGESCTKPKPQFVGIAANVVYSIGSGQKGYEKNIPHFDQGGPLRSSPIKARCIDGWIYICGGNNSVGKRVANGQWQSFSQNIPLPNQPGHYNIFNDIDGFAENDIYVVGYSGQVYHFNGKDWRSKTLPTNMDFQSLCCAGDGFVYISGMHGATYKGRGDRWKCLYKGHLAKNPLPGMVLGFKDMVWYEDRIWCTSDYGIWTIKDDKLEEADVPRFVYGCSGNLSTADGVLLLAGHGGAAFLENGQWQRIY